MTVGRYEPFSAIVSALVLAWSAGMIAGAVFVDSMNSGRLSSQPAVVAVFVFTGLALAKGCDIARRFGKPT